jgi:hypothetical protein
MSNDEVLIDINDDIANLEHGLDQLMNKQYNDHQSLLYKFRIVEFILAVQVYIIWYFILKVYK